MSAQTTADQAADDKWYAHGPIGAEVAGRLLDRDGSLLHLEYLDGSKVRAGQNSVRRLERGTLHWDLVTDPGPTRHLFADRPAEIVCRLLRESPGTQLRALQIRE